MVDDATRGGGTAQSSVAVELSYYKKVSINHAGSLTLAWLQHCAGGNEKEREWGRREREKQLKSLHRCYIRIKR